MDFPLERISGHCFAVIDDAHHVNAGAIILDETIFAIDPLFATGDALRWRKALEGLGPSLEALCVTHYHADHVFGQSAFRDVPRMASAAIVKNIQRRLCQGWSRETLNAEAKASPAEMGWLEDLEILIPNVLFDGEWTHPGHDASIRMIQAGGHTDCSVYVHIPEDRVVFAGDLLFANQFPWAGDATCDPDRWMGVLQDFLAMDVDTFVPGHGPIIGKPGVEKQLALFKDLKEETEKAIRAGRGPETIACPEYDPPDPRFPTLRINTLNHFHAFYTRSH